MTFVESDFAVFLLAFIAMWWATRRNYQWRLGGTLGLSLIFYGYHHWWFVPVILAYCFVDWGAALLIERSPHRKLILALGIGLNLTALSFWKYTPLLAATLAEMVGWPSMDAALSLQEGWIAPMGISFYAFMGISYMVDVYRGTITAEPNPWRYALFSSFFPHLVAGPILRAREFLWHLGPDTMMNRPSYAWEGTFLIGRGLFKKLVLADTIAITIDPFFVNVTDPSTAGVWSLPYVYLYALQIYFDFSGYTDIGRGLGLLFGFRWPENFNWPYLATSVQDFWRRWHMTLSRFLRDYLYISLGGSRHGLGRSIFATMVTMLLGGLWHGASWSFLIWGGLHGLFLVIHRFWSMTFLHERLSNLTGLARRLWIAAAVVLTFNTVCLTWCFFRLTKLPESLACVRKAFEFDAGKMFLGGSDDLALWTMLGGYGLAAALAYFITRGASLPDVAAALAKRQFIRGVAWGGSVSLMMVALALMQKGKSVPFIYFQF
ncbi:MAG: MBOAT family O-acyltransferase [Prosthecobacter sp.]|nr:MBOAT family O-acyltransferase [Prosthecobacter sp.]